MLLFFLGILLMLPELSFLEVPFSLGFLGGIFLFIGVRSFSRKRDFISGSKSGMFALIYAFFDGAHTLAAFFLPEETLLLFLLFVAAVLFKVLALSYFVSAIRESEVKCRFDLKGNTLSRLLNIYIVIAGASFLSYYSSFFSFFVAIFANVCAVIFAIFLLISLRLYKNYLDHIPLKKEQKI